MALTPCARIAAAYNWSLTIPFKTANTTSWMTFCVGPVPNQATLLDVAAITDTVIVNAKTGLIASNAGATWAYSSYVTPAPTYYAVSMPTVKTFTATQAGTITHACVNAGGFFIIVDVGMINSGAVIQLDKTVVNPGDVCSLQVIQYKMWS